MSIKKYLTKKLSIKKSNLTNILPTTDILRPNRLSQVFRHHVLYQVQQLPPKVDLRPDMTPVENQLCIGSSVANCLAGAYEYLTKKATGQNIDVSRLFIYYNARTKGNNSTYIIDSGCSVTDGIQALEKYGTCLEVLYPYDVSRVNMRPDKEVFEQAENHKINKALQINIDLNEMKSCLAQGYPFAFGMKLFSSFNQTAQTGIVTIPRIWEQREESIGSHAMLAVGYSDCSNAFIVRNSWGEDWGDQGYCYVPYEYLTNPNLCYDAWTIQKLDNSDFGREYWHFDDLVNYLNDVDENNEDADDTDNRPNWRDCYHRRRSILHDPWYQYRNYIGTNLSRNDDDYFDNRSRRDRYERDNDTYNQSFNNAFTNRNYSYPFDDRFQDENNHYRNSDDDFHSNNYRRSMF